MTKDAKPAAKSTSNKPVKQQQSNKLPRSKTPASNPDKKANVVPANDSAYLDQFPSWELETTTDSIPQPPSQPSPSSQPVPPPKSPHQKVPKSKSTPKIQTVAMDNTSLEPVQQKSQPSPLARSQHQHLNKKHQQQLVIINHINMSRKFFVGGNWKLVCLCCSVLVTYTAPRMETELKSKIWWRR